MPTGSLHGLCPKCLLLAGLTTPAQQAGSGAAEGAKPTVTLGFSPPVGLEKPGDRIGRYKLLQKLGEGGCGVVYMAEQEEPVRRRVALKVIKLGMDTEQVIARFEAERQALALMDHPHIAKVLDGGATAAGRPYFVMELVRGIPITRYCDENRLDTTQRLELFILVCQAVQHAHQKGIIHRDIKPSNILVADHDGTPVPKVIDFGIAKATAGQTLTDKTLFTAFEQFMGTPAYMSPEQAMLSGLDIDTRSDIYSLGVLLYELLTGKTPFEAKRLMQAGLDEIRRIIRQEDPPRPSTRLSTLDAIEQTTVARQRQSEPPKLAGLVRGDLDWIAMKCLEKDRTRRYETANGVSMDLKRFLNNEPVLARPPSNAYRLHKLVRRHKVAFAATTAVVLAMVGGLGVSTCLFIRERAARKQAATEAQKSQEVAHFLKDMLNGVGPSAAKGRDATMLREVLDKTAERVGRDLTNQPQVEAELRTTIGEVYWLLGDYQKANFMHTEALAIRRKNGSEPLEVATSLDDLAAVLWRQGKLAEAETMQREALDLRKRLQGVQHPDFAFPLTALAQMLSDEGKLPEAEAAQRQVLALRLRQAGGESTELADALKALASILWRQKRLEQAEVLDKKALTLQRRLLGKDDPEVAMTINDLATVLYLQGKFPEAEALFREAVSMAERLLSPEHPARLNLLANLATCLGEQGNFAEAEKSHRQLLEVRQRVLGPKHPRVAESLSNLARMLQAQNKLPEAESTERNALAMRKELLGNENIDVAVSLNHLTGILQDEGKFAEAETLAGEVLDMHRKVRGPEHQDVAGSLYNLASVLFYSGKLPDAEARARECRDLYEKILPDDWRKYSTQSLLGAILLKQKRYGEAESLLLDGYAGMKARQDKIPFIGRTRMSKAADWVVQLYDDWGKPDLAAEWREKAR